WATTKKSDDVEVDAGAFAGGGGFDEGAETADDASLAADDLADVFFVDFELVDGGVAILYLIDLHRIGFVDEGLGNVFNQTLQIGFEIFEILVVLELIAFFCFGLGRLGWLGLLGHRYALAGSALVVAIASVAPVPRCG